MGDGVAVVRRVRVGVAAEPGHGGARIELDGQIQCRVEPLAARTFSVALRQRHATLVALGGDNGRLQAQATHCGAHQLSEAAVLSCLVPAVLRYQTDAAALHRDEPERGPARV